MLEKYVFSEISNFEKKILEGSMNNFNGLLDFYFTQVASDRTDLNEMMCKKLAANFENWNKSTSYLRCFFFILKQGSYSFVDDELIEELLEVLPKRISHNTNSFYLFKIALLLVSKRESRNLQNAILQIMKNDHFD